MSQRLIGVFAFVAFLFIGMGQASAQSVAGGDIGNWVTKEHLKTRIVALNSSIGNLSATDAKAVYYTDLVAFYQAIVDDVEQNGKAYIQALRDNKTMMPLKAGETDIVRKDWPIRLKKF